MRRIHRAFLVIATMALAMGCSSDGGDDPQTTATAWEMVYQDANWWMSVEVTSQNDQWAVGGTPGSQSTTGTGAIVHFDGTSWSMVDTGIETGLLNWVHRFDDGELTVVGESGAVLVRRGETWSQQSTPTTENLWGVWGASPDDVFAVGGAGSGNAEATIIRRQNDTWEALEVGEGKAVDSERPNVRAFFKVWGSSANDVWVVGQYGAVVHFDGTQWQAHHTGTPLDLIAVWGTGPNNVVAVGGRGNGVATHWNGTDWTLVETEFEFDPGINGVWMRNETAHFAAGQGMAFTFDSGSLKKVSQRELTLDIDLHAVRGAADGAVTAVGGNLNASAGPYKGMIFSRTLGADE